MKNLEKDIYPSQWDLDHYGFFKEWRGLEKYFQNYYPKNESIKKFLAYLEKKYSIVKDDGLTIML